MRKSRGDLEQHKTEFLALAAHYFLTPLSVIRGTVANLLEPGSAELSPAIKRDSYQTIQANSNELLRMVENMLIIASIDSGQLKVTVQPVSIVSELDLCISEIYAEAARKNIAVAFDRPKQLNVEQVMVDAEKFRLAIINVLGNAVKFTKDYGSVKISLIEQDKRFLISIIDSGIGISASEMKQLFTRFHRGTSYLVMDYQGIGLGLYLAKYLLEANSSTIMIESKEGVGTSVRIEVPQ